MWNTWAAGLGCSAGRIKRSLYEEGFVSVSGLHLHRPECRITPLSPARAKE